jgi:predicted secreted protein
MANPVLLVQGTKLDISIAEVVDVAATLLPAAFESLDITAKSVQYQGGSADEIDTTVLASTAKEFRLGLQDAGTMSVAGHWVQGDAAQAVVKAAAKDKKTRLIRVTFNDGSTFSGLAFVSQRSWDAQVSGVVSATFNFRLTGDTLEVDAA